MSIYSDVKLDPDQLDAVHADGNVVCAACPGSGKTAVLTHRVKRLIDEGADPSRILAVTFLKKAQEALRDRLGDVVGQQAGLIQARTFHSIGAWVIREFGSIWKTGLGNAQIIDENEVRKHHRRFLKEAATDLRLKHLIYRSRERRHPRVTPYSVQRFASAFYDLLIPMDCDIHESTNTCSLKRSGIDYDPDVFDLLHETLKRVDEDKLHSGWLTYDDLLQKACLAMAEDPDVHSHVAGSFDHVLVDEYQDTSPSQQVMVDYMAGNASLFLVGDDDQCVYSWRRANPDLLIEATKSSRFHSVKLQRNYRSGQVILDRAQELIENNEKRIPKNLVGAHEGGEVDAVSFPDEYIEASWVVDKIWGLMQRGQPLHEVMVLTRTNAHLGDVAEHLAKRSIPYQMPPKVSGFANLPEVLDMESYVEMAVDPTDKVAFDRVHNRPWRSLPPRWSAAAEQVQKKTGVDFIEACTMVPPMGHDSRGEREGAVALQDTLSRVRGLLESGATTKDIVTSAIATSGYRGWLADDEDDEDNMRSENLDKVIEMSERYEKPQDFLDMLRGIRASRLKKRNKKNAVVLSTIHRAKGLEADVVFLLGCKPGRLPHARTENIPEERRLAYVACTRARNELYVTRDEQPVSTQNPALMMIDFIEELGLECRRPFAKQTEAESA